MVYHKDLADRVSRALAHLENVEPKMMFSGVAFMVNQKMCINVTSGGMMCRVDPKMHETLLEMPGCRSMVMKGRELMGWLLIDEAFIQLDKDLDFWISQALSFNQQAKSSKKKKQ